jgi:hypothetical protein
VLGDQLVNLLDPVVQLWSVNGAHPQSAASYQQKCRGRPCTGTCAIGLAHFEAVTEFSLYRKHRGSDLFETQMWEYADEAGMLRGRR